MNSTTKNKNYAVTIITTIVLCISLVLFAACGETKDKFKTDSSIAKVDGITVTMDKDTTQKEFSIENGDSQGRVDLFGDLGTLKQYTINVSGTVSRADCVENASARDANGDEVGEEGVVNYYTDWFEFKILVPENATHYKSTDGLPAKPVAELNIDDNGYWVDDVQWLLGDANQSNWTICGNATTNDGYFYYAFLDADGEIVDQYFVRVVYDVTFVD